MKNFNILKNILFIVIYLEKRTSTLKYDPSSFTEILAVEVLKVDWEVLDSSEISWV